ncbi:MAG TPA: hypothetical protein DD400_02320 [Rhodospirillaceae bacterium]|nr:hypothetical protein [Rhodospirillaceae bacterium]
MAMRKNRKHDKDVRLNKTRCLARQAAKNLGFRLVQSEAYLKNPMHSFVFVPKKARIFSEDSKGFEINLKKLMKGKRPNATKEQRAFTEQFEKLYGIAPKPRSCDLKANNFCEFAYN